MWWRIEAPLSAPVRCREGKYLPSPILRANRLPAPLPVACVTLVRRDHDVVPASRSGIFPDWGRCSQAAPIREFGPTCRAGHALTQALTPCVKPADKAGNIIARIVCRLKDWRRIATRDDEFANNGSSAVILAAIIIGRAK